MISPHGAIPDRAPPYRPGPEEKILLFDGECALCNGWVDFVIRRDPAAHVKFAALQSEMGARVLAGIGLDPTSFRPPGSSPSTLHSFASEDADDHFDSMIFVEAGRAHLRSSGFLRLVKTLRYPWPLLSIALFVPPFLRDWVYAQVAAHRYEWFGRREVCRIATPDVEAHFLTDR